MQIKIMFLVLCFSSICFGETLSSNLDDCFEGRTPAKLFLLNVDKFIKKDKKILKDTGLDGSIARTLGALSLPDTDTSIPENYDMCLSRLFESMDMDDQVKKLEAFTDWNNCIPESESIKKETVKLKKCFKVD